MCSALVGWRHDKRTKYRQVLKASESVWNGSGKCLGAAPVQLCMQPVVPPVVVWGCRASQACSALLVSAAHPVKPHKHTPGTKSGETLVGIGASCPLLFVRFVLEDVKQLAGLVGFAACRPIVFTSPPSCEMKFYLW